MIIMIIMVKKKIGNLELETKLNYKNNTIMEIHSEADGTKVVLKVINKNINYYKNKLKFEISRLRSKKLSVHRDSRTGL